MSMSETSASDARKARGAFFTPAPIARFIVDWAVRRAGDSVLDPSCGDAALLAPAAMKLLELSSARPVEARVRRPAIGEGQTARKEREVCEESPVGEKSAVCEAAACEAEPEAFLVANATVPLPPGRCEMNGDRSTPLTARPSAARPLTASGTVATSSPPSPGPSG